MASNYRTPYANPSTPNLHFQPQPHLDGDDNRDDNYPRYHLRPDDYPPPPLPKHDEYYPPLPPSLSGSASTSAGSTAHHTHSPSRSFTSASSVTLQHKAGVRDSTLGYDLENGAYDLPVPLPEKSPPVKTWWELLIPSSWACRLYIAVVVVQTIIDLAVEVTLFNRLSEARPADQSLEAKIKFDNTLKQQSVYLGIFVLAHVFQLALAIDAVAARNVLQFIGLTILNAIFLAYAVFQTESINDFLVKNTSVANIPMGALRAIIITTIAVAEIAYIGLAWQIYREFGWKVYKFLGADRRLKRVYQHYQIFQFLVKFDVFFWVGFTAQLIFLVLQPADAEYFLTILALPLSILLLVEGHLAARFENRWLMGSFMLGCIGGLIYSVYKMLKIWGGVNGDFKDVYKMLTTFAAISILFLLTTFIWACLVMNNFGAGLKTQISKRQAAKAAKAVVNGQIRRRGTERFDPNAFAAALPKRMSID